MVEVEFILFRIVRRIPRRGISGIIIADPLPPTGIRLSGIGSLPLSLATTLSPCFITSLPKRGLIVDRLVEGLSVVLGALVVLVVVLVVVVGTGWVLVWIGDD